MVEEFVRGLHFSLIRPERKRGREVLRGRGEDDRQTDRQIDSCRITHKEVCSALKLVVWRTCFPYALLQKMLLP